MSEPKTPKEDEKKIMTSTSTSTGRTKQLENLENALDDVPIDPDDAHATVAKLGVNVQSLAARIRATVATHDSTADRGVRYEQARAAYTKDVLALEKRHREPMRPREEQLAIFEVLLARIPPQQALAMHFHKYESASTEELGELIRSLRHLLSNDNDND